MKVRQLRINQILNQFSRLTTPTGADARPLAQQNLLFWVAAEPTPPRPTHLAAAMGLSKAAITKMMTPLLEEGLLERRPVPTDNRSFQLLITAQGKDVVRALAPAYFEPMATLRAGMGKKQFKRLIKLLDQANAVLTAAE